MCKIDLYTFVRVYTESSENLAEIILNIIKLFPHSWLNDAKCHNIRENSAYP